MSHSATEQQERADQLFETWWDSEDGHELGFKESKGICRSAFLAALSFPSETAMPEFVVCSDQGVVQNIQYKGEIYVPERAAPSATRLTVEIPDGWQIVPKEPTPAMCEAGFSAACEHDNGLSAPATEISPATYKAMLTAAPKLVSVKEMVLSEKDAE